MDTEGEKLKEPNDWQDCSKILFSGCNIYITSINSQHLQFSTQDVHMAVLVHITAWRY